jgi:acetylornithine aminotransferase
MKLFDVYPLYEVTPVKARGVYVYDQKRQKYLDLYGGHAVISIGHSHPYFVRKISRQLKKIGFYSNAIQNPLQSQLASTIGEHSHLHEFELFLCSTGAEAIENALKLSSFHTGRKKVISFRGAFHGRTSAAVAVTDNKAINAPLNSQHEVTFLPFNDIDKLEKELAKQTYCAVIFESIQGVGGLDEPDRSFVVAMDTLCKKYGSCLIADEVQSGFGRSGTFFAFQKYPIKPHIITMAKGMGNGFPIGGILIHPEIKANFGMLGTTFGGNHLACVASLAVLDILKKEHLQEKVENLEIYFRKKAAEIPEIIKVKGRGLMLGLEFNFEIGDLRKSLVYNHHIFTGGSSNKKLIRILPPLTLKEKHFDIFFKALKTALENNNSTQ